MVACKASCTRKKKEKAEAAAKRKTLPDAPAERQLSFYQRKLPETCVAFASPEGKKIFKSALQHDGLKSFYNLIEQHHTQTEPAFCGVSTLVLVLNALAVDPGQNWKGPWRWYEEKMLNCCVDLEEIKQAGITLQDFQCLAFCQGLSVDLHYCDETSSLEKFREAVERACVEEPFEIDEGKNDQVDEPKILECLVVSYSRKVLKQTGDGHFSPLAAYDRKTDSVLILDTARFKYGAHWTKLPLIYEAMKPIDKSTGRSRGYALLSFVPEAHPPSNHSETAPPSPIKVVATTAASEKAGFSHTLISTSKLSTQPASILYRSMMNQKRKRRRYKEFVRSLRENDDRYSKGEDIPYDVVRSYWCEGGDRPSSVWEIIVPTRVRTEEEKIMLRKMRLLLSDLHHATMCRDMKNDNSSKETEGDEKLNCKQKNCRTCEKYNPATNHTISVSAEETLYIIYLATLSEDRRYDFVMNFDSPKATDVVRKQIIKEADMIASAIEVSDQLNSL